MLIQNSDDSISFTIFSQFPQLVCYMSTRKNGDLGFNKNFSDDVVQFLLTNKIKLQQLVAMEQVHKNNLKLVGSQNGGQIIPNTDGMVTITRELFLVVNTADCVPLYFYDPKTGAIGVAHAGWKGTLDNITGNIIQKLEALGSDLKDIYVAIGPHIGGCCYDVKSDRARLFYKTFPSQQVEYSIDGVWHIDLGFANRIQMLNAGIDENHIDTPITCTSCQNDCYYSFRKDTHKTFGKMIGVIGLRS